jgi:urease accessory protein
LIQGSAAVLDKVARCGQSLGKSDKGEGDGAGAGSNSASFVGAVEASLHFCRAGGRTVLARQRLPYPFHATRTFYLDRANPEIATLYLQSASGGLYRGDRHGLSFVVGPNALAHVTTQASTIVHHTHKNPASQRIRIEVGDGAFAAMTPEPLVLFPGAGISCVTDVTLAATGCAILIDGVTHHDPEGQGRPFDRYSNVIVVRNAEGTVLLADRGSIAGELMTGPVSPLGPFSAVGTLLVLGQGSQRCDPEILENCIAARGCMAGISQLPNAAGIGGRILAANGGVLAHGLEAAFAIVFEALIGARPARRRK